MQVDRLSRWLLLATLFVLASCAVAPQAPIPFSRQSLAGDREVIAVVSTKVPEVAVAFPGADCLLCLGVAMVAHSTFREHVATLKPSELSTLQDDLVNRLRHQGLTVVKLTEPIDLNAFDFAKEQKEGFAQKDFSRFKKEGVTSLLVLDYKFAGFSRAFAAYLPKEPMKATLFAESFLVRLEDGKLTWFQRQLLTKGVEGEWDRPPAFPELTGAYRDLVQQFRQSVLGAIQ